MLWVLSNHWGRSRIRQIRLNQTLSHLLPVLTFQMKKNRSWLKTWQPRNVCRQLSGFGRSSRIPMAARIPRLHISIPRFSFHQNESVQSHSVCLSKRGNQFLNRATPLALASTKLYNRHIPNQTCRAKHSRAILLRYLAFKWVMRKISLLAQNSKIYLLQQSVYVTLLASCCWTTFQSQNETSQNKGPKVWGS